MLKILLRFFFAFNLFWALNLYADTLYPSWLRYGLKIISNFGTQNEAEGYGIIINDGLILTSAKNVYRNTRLDNILLYDTEVLGEPITCLGYAKAIAIDTDLDLAVLATSEFTDIYCNRLPEGNFRSLVFDKSFLDLFDTSHHFTLDDKNMDISYLDIGDWLEFQRKSMPLGEFMSFLQSQEESLLGMPLFIKGKDSFVGIVIARSDKKILRTQEIVRFICKVNQQTNIFNKYPSIQKYCQKHQ